MKVFDEPLGESNTERRVKISASVLKEGTWYYIYYQITKFATYQEEFHYTAPAQYCSRELKQTDTAAANLQISIQKDSRPSEFSRPLASITLNLNGDLPVDRRCHVSFLKLPDNDHHCR